MATQDQLLPLMQAYAAFRAANLGNFQSELTLNGYTAEDIRRLYSEVVSTFETAQAQQVFQQPQVSFSFLNALTGTLNSIVQQQQMLKNPQTQEAQKNQYFNGILSLLDSALLQFRMYGVLDLLAGGLNLEQQRDRLRESAEEINQLLGEAGEMNALSRAVLLEKQSNRISDAFASRKTRISSYRTTWMWVSIVAIVLTSILTLFVIVPFVEASRSQDATSAQGKSLPDTQNATPAQNPSHEFAIGLALRLSGVTPLILFAFFAVSQYNKERDFEEQYAHRESVSSSIPGYSALIQDANLRDLMSKDATGIIFSVPQLHRSDKIEDKALKLVGKIADVIRK